MTFDLILFVIAFKSAILNLGYASRSQRVCRKTIWVEFIIWGYTKWVHFLLGGTILI
jgi:hypothetical protein